MPEGRTRELSAGEEARLFAHLRPDYQPLFWFLLMSGVRVSNATGLKWDQVDFHERKIVFRTKSRRPGRKLHVLPMTNAMLTLLANQSGHHPSFVFTFVCQKNTGGRRGNVRYPFTMYGWRRQWKSALEAAGINDFRPHDLRHTAATRLARVASLHVVQRLLGHANITDTARYANASKEDVVGAMEEVERRNSPELKKPESHIPLNVRKKS